MKPIDVVYAIKVYPNRFCIAVKNHQSQKITDDLKRIRSLDFNDAKYRWIGFNNRRYAHPMLEACLRGANVRALYQLSQDIISDKNSVKPSWNENIIDAYEICPKSSQCSLKEFGHRLGFETLQAPPYPFNQPLNDLQWGEVKDYCCGHDLNITWLVWENLKSEYITRQNLKLHFNIKTEFGGAPNLAQKAIISQLGDEPVDHGKTLVRMGNLKLSPYLQKIHDACYDLDFKGYFNKNAPAIMEDKKHVNGLEIKIARGGLHGISTPGVYRNVYEYDVRSYYPSIILNCKLGSDLFRKVYKRIYDKRIELKREGDIQAQSLKLILNSTWGQFNNVYAKPQMRAPHLAISICLLGQFYLLDLIEKTDRDSCVVANTDGIMCKNPVSEAVLSEWQTRTGFNLELTEYSLLVLKGMNSYYAVDVNGKEKRKNDFLERNFNNTANGGIVGRAVLSYLLENTPIEDTIRGCQSIYEFCYFRKAIGERWFECDGEKMEDSRIRFFVSEEGLIVKSIGEEDNKRSEIRLVATSPISLMMNIDNKALRDVNYDWYIKKANNLLEGLA